MKTKKRNQGARHPITVVEDRYRGTYSGGRFTAWDLPPSGLPSAIVGDDETCQLFWAHADEERWAVGVGRTRAAGVRDVCSKQKRGCRNVAYLADWLPAS